MNADIMNADMSVPTRQQISAQQRISRLKNKIFLSAYRNGDEMTPEEEERGFRLQLARIKKNEKQRERYRRTAEEERKLKNELKLKNTDICKGEKVAAVKVKVKALCSSFEGCNNLIRAGRVCSRHGNKQELAVRRVVQSKLSQGECVLIMVQGPNIAAMQDVLSRLSGEGSAKITLGL
jgi:hypothetical protein